MSIEAPLLNGESINAPTVSEKKRFKVASGVIGGCIGLALLATFVTLAIVLPAHHRGDGDDVKWGACPFGSASAETGSVVTCAQVEVPLFPDEPKRAAPLKLWVTRLSSAGATPGNASRHLWIVNGGPGCANEMMATLLLDMDHVVEALGGDLEIFFPDHRGTGLSTPWLNCSTPDVAHAQQCIEELKEQFTLDGVHQFSTTNAAKDTDKLMKLISGKAKEVHLYGASYGTFLVQRILLLNLSVPLTSVILDGVVPPDGSLALFDYQMNSVGTDFFSACTQNEDCAAGFGGENPYDQLELLFDRIETDPNETCFAKLGPQYLGMAPKLGVLFGSFIQDATMRLFIPPLVSRLLRCNEADVKALISMLQYFANSQHPAKFPTSPLLFIEVTLSSIFGRTEPPSYEQLNKWYNEARFKVEGPTTPELRQLYDFWPRYEHDEYYGNYPLDAARNVPMMLLNGDLDPNTPFFWAASVAKRYEGTKAVLVPVHESMHGVIMYGDVPGSTVSCGIQLMSSFINSANHTVDRSCISKMAPIDWAGKLAATRAKSLEVFGTEDMWGL